MSTFRPALALLLGTAAMLVSSGCATTIDAGGDRTVRVALSEYRVTPQSIHATAGLLSLWVHNYGRLTHSLVVSHDGETQASTGPLAPGQGTELDISVSPGQYVLASSILSDQALGAYGTLSVGR